MVERIVEVMESIINGQRSQAISQAQEYIVSHSIVYVTQEAFRIEELYCYGQENIHKLLLVIAHAADNLLQEKSWKNGS